VYIDKFSDIWNAFIISLRDEDLISDRFVVGVNLSTLFVEMFQKLFCVCF
jgi:hypothetical protein